MKSSIEVFANYDWSLLMAALALSALGLLAIYGINISGGDVDFFQFRKQLIALGIGLVIALGAAFVDYRHIRTLSLPIFLAGILMLVAVLIIGTTGRNAGRWFVLGTISFQPVEIAKVTLGVFLAAYLSRYVHRRLTWSAFIGSLVVSLPYFVLVLLQPDFGSAMILIALWISIILFSGLPKHAWWILLMITVVLGSLFWSIGLQQYQKDRVLSFINPSMDPYGASYNVTQARIAIGSGGWLGKGIGEGSQARLRFLPEASTDFMFAVLGEELGFVGLAIVLSLFAFIFYRFTRIAMESADAFAGILLIGLSSIIALHLIINAGMNMGLLPVTGIPLPFASAAASSLVSMFVIIAIAESVAVSKKHAFTDK
ncbi:MAG: FtsW/RodA/SpoVE family cell cycle protein [Patescibacteria group bacterium]